MIKIFQMSGSIGNGLIKKGRPTRGYIILRIPYGFHANSFKPKNEHAIPTRVKLSAVGVNTYGITYPPGRMRKFSYSDKPINVYENLVVFGFKVKAPSKTHLKEILVKASVRYQACTDELCYPPRTKAIKIRAKIR